VLLRRAALVAAGGAVGTTARLMLGMLVADAPGGALLANVVGALLLGVVTALLPASDLRLLLGTGLLGGFTTYSAFAVDVVLMWGDSPVSAAGFIGASLLGGLLAAAVGLRVGARLSRGRAS